MNNFIWFLAFLLKFINNSNQRHFFLNNCKSNDNRISKITFRFFSFLTQQPMNLPIVRLQVTILSLPNYIAYKFIDSVFKLTFIIVNLYHKLIIRDRMINQHKPSLINRQNKRDYTFHEPVTSFKLINLRHFPSKPGNKNRFIFLRS